jgi:undecaprenyl-diphosphatase
MPSRALLSGAGVSAAAFLALAIVAGQGHLFAVDLGTRELVGLMRSHWLQGPMQMASVLGDGMGLVPLIALASAVLWRPSRHWALMLPGVMAGAGSLQWVAKWSIDRPRPDLSPWGFPSGHVLILVVFFGLMAWLMCQSTRCRPWRSLGTAVCLTIVLTVAYSRLYLDVHWLSDLLGGLTIGLAYLLAIIWLVEHARARRAGSLTLAAPLLTGAADAQLAVEQSP